VIRYIGARKDGVSAGGATSEEPVALVERLYASGWTRLVVTDAASGRVVGEIGHREDRRIWWAEARRAQS
jgi:hypothetical protein